RGARPLHARLATDRTRRRGQRDGSRPPRVRNLPERDRVQPRARPPDRPRRLHRELSPDPRSGRAGAVRAGGSDPPDTAGSPATAARDVAAAAVVTASALGAAARGGGDLPPPGRWEPRAQ